MGWECHWVWRNVCFSYRHFTRPVTPCPPRALWAHGAEELDVAGEIPEQVVAEFDAVDELRVVAGFAFIPHGVEPGCESQVKVRRQFHLQRQDKAPFHSAVADALLACGKLHVWRRCERCAPAIIAPEVVFEPEPGLAKPAPRHPAAVLALVKQIVRLQHALAVELVE